MSWRWEYVVYEMYKGLFGRTKERRLRVFNDRTDADGYVTNYLKLNPDAIIRIQQRVPWWD
ncbi:hypothetical protein CPY53_04285 [Paenibacillus polymyxa]|uniref:hypothetical protein n=1 Tax=Paenibacillus polymyxa TaxID=1406 RepID=UPI0005ED28E1|nr:hypothetical protein [Paenibacillus polymyxa]KJK28475.1 hypothetical protein TY89_23175 [Paenibacillus polymyxa]UNL92823.1 hypothetical protein CPY53_04285 [Paenibacillus polymyxa]